MFDDELAECLSYAGFLFRDLVVLIVGKVELVLRHGEVDSNTPARSRSLWETRNVRLFAL